MNDGQNRTLNAVDTVQHRSLFFSLETGEISRPDTKDEEKTVAFVACCPAAPATTSPNLQATNAATPHG